MLLLADQAKIIPGVKLYGQYDTFHDVASNADLFIFPMRFGGGIKVKVIEAISMGLPIVTTASALRGFPPDLRQYVWVADSPESFIDAVVHALAEVDERADRAMAARLLLTSTMPTWSTVAGKLADIWREHASKG